MNKKILLAGMLFTTSLFANEGVKEVQDMSDPMAIYSSIGASYGSNGANLKFMSMLDTGVATEQAVIVGEIKNGYSSSNEFFTDFRLRHFSVDMTNGRGTSIDAMYNTTTDTGVITKGFMQALPVSERLTLYPILGAGFAFSENELAGIYIPGALVNFTMYSKLEITDKVWFNYNPSYSLGIYGSDFFKNSLSGTNGLQHEFIMSYQINPTTNLRLWYNASHENFDEGDYRLEINRQL